MNFYITLTQLRSLSTFQQKRVFYFSRGDWEECKICPVQAKTIRLSLGLLPPAGIIQPHVSSKLVDILQKIAKWTRNFPVILFGSDATQGRENHMHVPAHCESPLLFFTTLQHAEAAELKRLVFRLLGYVIGVWQQIWKRLSCTNVHMNCKGCLFVRALCITK